MNPLPPEPISIETTIEASVGKVWECFTRPEHIKAWNHASDDWHSPRADNDVRTGGSFSIRMEAKDGSQGFDFTGTYDEVVPEKRLEYTMGDGRKVFVTFDEENGSPRGEASRTRVSETFEPENENPIGVQREGWQSILDAFKAHVEGH